MARWRLNTAVFLAGAVVMAFEMAGSRVMAPAVGTSIVVWTALIGIILASLSFGYWWGGRLADRDPRPARLAVLLALSALAIAVTALVAWPVVSLLAAVGGDLRLTATLGSVILFAPAALLLGTVSPFAAKLAIRDLATDGRTVGTLYAISTAGSIVGTFAGGFLLIPILGTTWTLGVLAITAIVAAMLIGAGRTTAAHAGLALILVGAAIRWDGAGAVTIIDTPYQRLLISTAVDASSGKPIRTLANDPYGTQAAQFLDSDELVFAYTKFFRLGERLGSAPANALTIGGAAYTWPRDFLARNPSAQMTVVEIDPGMTAVARELFRLTDDPRLAIVHEDGRTFLNTASTQYDAIYLDAFSGLTIPFQLVTREAVLKMHDRLTPDGIVMANLIGSTVGEANILVRSVASTFSTVFPHVNLFLVGRPDKPEAAQNIMLVATLQEPAFPPDAVPYSAPLEPGRVLTDDHAPVEQMTAQLLRHR